MSTDGSARPCGRTEAERVKAWHLANPEVPGGGGLFFSDMPIGATVGSWRRISEEEFEYTPLIEVADPAQLAMELDG